MYSQAEHLPSGVSAPNGLVYDKPTNEFYAVADNDVIIRFKNEQPKLRRTEIFISELNYDETNILYHPRDSVKLNHYQNSVSLYFNVIDFNLRYPRKFKYSIDGDSIWRSVEQKQPVFIYNLGTGWHSVKIKSDYEGSNSSAKTFHLYIQPPFWKTSWFYAIVACLAVVSLYLIIAGILKRSKREQRINSMLKEFEFKALHAQMNPHFIFNSLNSIKALIMYNRNTEASQYLNKFSSLVRQNLDHSRKQFLTLQQNIDYIRQYIEIESIRFKDLQSEIITDPRIDTSEIRIAPMLLQPLIENAIWHGLQSATGPKTLIVRFSTRSSTIVCEIEDNGIGITRSQSVKKKRPYFHWNRQHPSKDRASE